MLSPPLSRRIRFRLIWPQGRTGWQCAGWPLQGLPNILADDYELTRGGVSYTIETMRHMRECYSEDDFYLIMGTDNYLTFTAWREWQALGRMCTLAVASPGRGR